MTPDLQAVLFFAFFILTDPPTSPVKYPDQIVCGVIVAAASYAVFELVGAAYYLLAGVLVGQRPGSVAPMAWFVRLHTSGIRLNALDGSIGARFRSALAVCRLAPAMHPACRSYYSFRYISLCQP